MLNRKKIIPKGKRSPFRIVRGTAGVWMALVCLVILSACEIAPGASGEKDVAVQSSPADAGPETMPSGARDLVDAATMSAQSTGGAVTIYNLDAADPAKEAPEDNGRKERKQKPLPLSLQSAADPSVDVYPLDYGAAADSGMRWAGSGILMPSGRQAMTGTEGRDVVMGNGLVKLYFAHGSSRVSSDARRTLEELAAWAGRTGGTIIVEGHASQRAEARDMTGRESINLKQSLNRAYAVSRELLRLGVSPDQVVTSGFGDSRPAMAETGRSAEAASRRVEIYTEGDSSGLGR